MKARLIIAPLLTAAACAALWFAYDNVTELRRIPELRGTMVWELRYLLLGCGFIVLLSIVERIAAAIGRPKDADPETPADG